MDSEKVKNAFEVIKQAMVQDDPGKPGSYAHSWHCNIAMACYDAGMADSDRPLHYMGHEEWHKIGNDAASRFMKQCFGVETKP